MGRLCKDFQVGSEDQHDCLFVGQRTQWKTRTLPLIELQEITFDKYLKDDTPLPLTPQTHCAYRSLLGQINWLQSRTQFHIGYQFSRCASKASSPTIEDVRAINKTVNPEQRDLRQGSSNSRGSLVDYETHKTTATTMSTTVAELHGLMRCYGSALFLRGLWSYQL